MGNWLVASRLEQCCCHTETEQTEKRDTLHNTHNFLAKIVFFRDVLDGSFPNRAAVATM